ncbi:hypothetical protein SO802_018705 [Lithocarpus litseifolius]|uniref:HAT C-terminal dimerisation domain-containing protein n=1 Tax=Lithocarpus litseifolius TaxID=425828 RepID=A0AAW2CLK7_9ROSI
MGATTILDPRYKMKLLEFYYPNIYGKNSDLKIENINNLCYELLDEYRDADGFPMDNEGSSHMPITTSNDVAQIKYRFQNSLASFDLFVNITSRKHESTRMEFDHYIDKGVLKRNEDYDILAWWKSNSFKCPALQRIVRDILAILVTIVASEFASSFNRRLSSPQRSQLHLKTIEALMCAQNWL